MTGQVEFSIFLIFVGAAVMATLALYARQAMIVGYIILGVMLGPWGMGLVSDAELIQQISNVGIVFLLYLLGLDLLPQQLCHFTKLPGILFIRWRINRNKGSVFCRNAKITPKTGITRNHLKIKCLPS